MQGGSSDAAPGPSVFSVTRRETPRHGPAGMARRDVAWHRDERMEHMLRELGSRLEHGAWACEDLRRIVTAFSAHLEYGACSFSYTAFTHVELGDSSCRVVQTNVCGTVKNTLCLLAHAERTAGRARLDNMGLKWRAYRYVIKEKYIHFKRAAARMPLPYDARGCLAKAFYKRSVSARQSTCLANDTDLASARMRLCAHLLSANKLLLRQKLEAVEAFLAHCERARIFLRECTRATERAVLFLRDKGAPILDVLSSNADSLATLCSYLDPADAGSLLMTHPAFNVDAVRRRLPRIVFSPSTPGWEASSPEHTATFRTGTLFDVGVVFAIVTDAQIVQVSHRRFFGQLPALTATLRFDTPSAERVPDGVWGSALQLGHTNKDAEGGHMQFVRGIAHTNETFPSNRVRVLASSHEYRKAYLHEMHTELAAAREHAANHPLTGHRRVFNATEMLRRNSRVQHFFLELTLQAVSLAGHSVSMTTRTPPFTTGRKVKAAKRPRDAPKEM